MKNNSGNYNSGNWNSGYYNSGNWNSGYYNSGFFNIDEPEKIRVFGKEVPKEKWEEAEKPKFLYFSLTEFITHDKMSEEEKEANPGYKNCGGFLKKFEYKEAFNKSFEDLNEEEKQKQIKQLKKLPNFDEKIFYVISGIDIRKFEYKEYTVEELEKILGEKIKIKGEKW